jgi:micrococcal nuclease
VRRRPGIGAIALLAVALVLLARACSEEGEPGGPATAGQAESARVVRVIDGDTIEVSIEGAEEDVRYIGVDTPETVNPGAPVQCYGRQASAANQRLVEGHTVRLVFDRERRDAYGRLLAYVYVADGSGGEQLVNEALVAGGFATPLSIAPNGALAPRFAAAARAAEAAGLGLWAACAG